MKDHTETASGPESLVDVPEAEEVLPEVQPNPDERTVGDCGPADAPLERPAPGALSPAVQTAPLTDPLPITSDQRLDVKNLRVPELYLNRELTWLQFNMRVLNEARDRRTPVLERVKFLAIADNNMDEFFMKRIGGLKQQIGAGVHKLSVDGRTPAQQLEQVQPVVARFRDELEDVYRDLIGDLTRQGIRIRSFASLSAGGAKRRAAVLRRQHISAHHTPGHGSGPPVSIHLEFVAQPARHSQVSPRG